MAAVTLAQEEVALVVKRVPLVVGLILENKALLTQALANEAVGILEKVAQFGILVGVAIDLVEGIEEVVGAGGVGETFDECLEFCQR